MSEDRKIVIVGAGPTGLTAAILLRLRGFNPIVLDRRPSLSGHPAAHVANTRTMEILAELGVAEEIWSVGDRYAMGGFVAWVESLAGRQFGILPIKGAAFDGRGPLSAYNSVNIAQNVLEGILYDRLIELGGLVRFGEEVVSVANTHAGVKVDVSTIGTLDHHRFECDWLLGCDGAGSAVRRSSGIEMDGPRTIARFLTIYFEGDLEQYQNGRRASLYWIGGPQVRGAFINFGSAGQSWAMLVPIGDLAVENFDGVAAKRIVQKAIGDLGAPISLRAISSWNMSAQVAQTYRRGNIFLAGDACHRFPPTGGLGMNTGIQDAHNLIWKLAAVIEGHSAKTLLDSYEVERRPIARKNSDQSVRNLMKLGMIDDALGILTLAPVTADAADGPMTSWRPELLRLDGESEEIAERRAVVQSAIDAQSEHFDQGAGMDLGFSYFEGAFVPDGSPPPSKAAYDYRPDAHPGARLPYSSADGSFANSTLGVVRSVGATLFAFDGRWRKVAEDARVSADIDIAVVVLGEAGGVFGSQIGALLGIDESGAVAVRPDGIVLWRCPKWPEAPELVLRDAISTALAARARHPAI